MVGPIHVVGIGLDGLSGLSPASQSLLAQATVVVGSDRHLDYCPNPTARKIPLGNIKDAMEQVQEYFSQTYFNQTALNQTVFNQTNPNQPTSSSPKTNAAQTNAAQTNATQAGANRATGSSSLNPIIVILVSGDPLFFGLGRLLLEFFPADLITFHPHLSSVQLAFNRIKVPWQDATIISAHGRTLDPLISALKKGAEKIAILTDKTHNPVAIARLIQALNSPCDYRIWVCENLADDQEAVQQFTPEALIARSAQPFAVLNIVILIREQPPTRCPQMSLPLLGIADENFASFRDRPGLITKREVRTLILGELNLQPHQVVWDIGAGTGSVSIEIARLNPTATVYAIEKTIAGITLITTNCQRFQIPNIVTLHAAAPEGLNTLPTPDRIFIGGSGGHLAEIMDICGAALNPNGQITLALATFEHQSTLWQWVQHQDHSNQPYRWSCTTLSVNLSRSIPIGSLTRLHPLNPVTLITVRKRPKKVPTEHPQ